MLQNIDCGYSLEPPLCFGAKIRKISFFLMKFSFFTGEKNLCILHGQVFVMMKGSNEINHIDYSDYHDWLDINPYLTNGFAHHYQLSESNFVFRGVRIDF